MLSLKLKGISQNNNHSHNVAFKLLSEIKFRTNINSFLVLCVHPLCLLLFLSVFWKRKKRSFTFKKSFKGILTLPSSLGYLTYMKYMTQILLRITVEDRQVRYSSHKGYWTQLSAMLAPPNALEQDIGSAQ